MEEQLVCLFVVLSADLDHIMEVALAVRFKRHVNLDGQTSSHWALHVVVALEFVSLGLGELYATNFLGDVADCDRHLIVLMGFNI